MANRYLQDVTAADGKPAPSPAMKHVTPPPTGPVAVRLSDVTPKPVSWLWPGRIPLGRITLLAGRPGIGKSFITMDIASRVSRGTDWPDGSPCPAGSVLLLAAEDDAADTVRPRLDAAGADASKVVALVATRSVGKDGRGTERGVTLTDLDVITDQLDTMPDCRLIIIDPVGSYLGGGVDGHRDNEVRSVLAPLGMLAAVRSIAVVVVAHKRKSSSGTADDVVLGSVGFVGLARSVLHVMADPDDPTNRRRLLLPGKCNLAAPPAGLIFEIMGDPACVGWGDETELTADEALARSGERSDRPGPDPVRRDAAVNWLKELLQAGPQPVNDIEEAAKQAGLPWRTVRRAREVIGIKPTKSGFSGHWRWALPEDAQAEDGQRSCPSEMRPGHLRAYTEETSLFCKGSAEDGQVENHLDTFEDGQAENHLDTLDDKARLKHLLKTQQLPD